MKPTLRSKLIEKYVPKQLSVEEQIQLQAEEKIKLALNQIPRLMADTVEENSRFSPAESYPFVFIGNHPAGKIALEYLQEQFAKENISFFLPEDEKRDDGGWWCVNLIEMRAAHEKLVAEDNAELLRMMQSR